jgi:hypothetical protein
MDDYPLFLVQSAKITVLVTELNRMLIKKRKTAASVCHQQRSLYELA